MINQQNDLSAAKEQLRIPQLWTFLNLPGTPAKSCRCPWRDDKKPSFSIYAEGRRWRDFAADEGGDAIDFLAKARGLSIGEAIREFNRLSNL